MFKGFMDHVPKDVTLHEHASVMVNMMQPYQIDTFYKNQWRACFTMWESTQLNQRFIDWMNVYDQIIVPCDHNVELFSRHHKNVHKVPLGVDTKIWKPKQRSANPRFRFHAGGSQWLRKGLDIVLEAFKLADLDAELHLKPNPEAHGVPDLKLPDNVFMHRAWFTDQETIDYFHQADCYIAVTRGEGFGLMPLQAISLGMPTIVSDSTGHQEFSYLATGVVPTVKAPAKTIGQWDEPDVDTLADIMLDHYRNWSTHQAEAVVNSRGASAFTWRKATKALLDAVPVGEILPDTAVVPAVVNVEIQVKRKVSCNIANIQYHFVPGDTYWVSEDVQRVLNDAGYLV